jgi:hypothetical protein
VFIHHIFYEAIIDHILNAVAAVEALVFQFKRAITDECSMRSWKELERIMEKKETEMVTK